MPKLGILGAIARQEWMTPIETGLQKGVHKAFTSGGETGAKLKNALHGTWLGHPLHVVLTDFPIGAWTAALVFDALDSIRGGEDFATAADGCVAIGLAAAVGAAVTGLTDWQDVDPPARRIGLTHGLMNIGGAALFTASLIQRRRDERGAGKGLALLGFIVATAAARLGGNLVYEQQLGVDHTSGQRMPEEFATVLPEGSLAEGEMKRVEHDGTRILLVRRGQRIFALAETCTHLGGPLAEGTLREDSVQCPWHGSRFALEDGRVLGGPAVHPAPCLEVRVRNGQIEVRREKKNRDEATPVENPKAA